MTKRTRSEFERVVLPSDGENIVSAATSEVELAVAEGSLEDWPVTVGSSLHQDETHTPADVAPASVAVVEGSADGVASANWALEGEFGSSPFWALLARVGYTPWWPVLYGLLGQV